MAKPDTAIIKAISQKLAVKPRAIIEIKVKIDPQTRIRRSPSRLEICPKTSLTARDATERIASKIPMSVTLRPISRPYSGKKISTTSTTAVVALATNMADLKVGIARTWVTLSSSRFFVGLGFSFLVLSAKVPITAATNSARANKKAALALTVASPESARYPPTKGPMA